MDKEISTIEDRENSLDLSCSEAGSTTDDPPHVQVEHAETINEDNTTDITVSFKQSLRFPEIAETDNEYKTTEEDLVIEGLRKAFNLLQDTSALYNKISNASAKCELLENKLKLQNIQYKAMEKKTECLNLFLDSILENIGNAEYREFTDEEIVAFSQDNTTFL